MLKESEEDDEVDDGKSVGDVSDSGTMRRSSRGETMTESTIDEGTEWTGSYVSGSRDGSELSEEERAENGVVLFEEGEVV